MNAKLKLPLIALFLCCTLTQIHAQKKDNNATIKRSLAFQRYQTSNLNFEAENPFFPMFSYAITTGLGYKTTTEDDALISKKLTAYTGPSNVPQLVRLRKQQQPLRAAYYLRHALEGFEENTTYRDVTSPIKIGDTYHIWYSKSWGVPPVGQKKWITGILPRHKKQLETHLFMGFRIHLACHLKRHLQLERRRHGTRTRTYRLL